MQDSQDLPSWALLPFFILTFAITWGIVGLFIFFPRQSAALLGEISGAHPAFFVATWAPAISGIGLVALLRGRTGVRGLMSRVLIWRIAPAWALLVLVGLPLVFTAGSLIKGGPWIAPLPPQGIAPVLSVMVMMAFLGPMEEFGWRGVAQPLLQRHVAPIWAGLLIGAAWGLWHLPAFYLSGVVHSGWNFTPFFLGNVAIAVLVTPLFNAGRGGLLWPMLYHWQLINPFWPDAAPWDTIILIGVAGAATWLNRGTLFTRTGAVTTVTRSPG